MMSSSDENSATADRVEKKSIDEAIASFAMLVRLGNRFFASSSFTSSSSSHTRARYEVF